MERAVAAQLQREMKWNTSTDRDVKIPVRPYHEHKQTNIAPNLAYLLFQLHDFNSYIWYFVPHNWEIKIKNVRLALDERESENENFFSVWRALRQKRTTRFIFRLSFIRF